MLCVYDSKCINFSNNGLVVLDSPLAVLISEELNGQYELELEYPLDDRGKWAYLIEDNIIKADGQLFRIYRKVTNLTSRKVNARHIFYDLLDNFVEDCQLSNITGYGALDSVLSSTQYPHGFINMGDVGGSFTAKYARKNPVECIMGSSGIINTWGGEIVRDNFTIKLLQSRGQDRGVLVAYGKNISGIEETLDSDGICTRLLPVGKDGLLLTEKYIDSPYINSFPHPKVKPIEFNDIEDEATLRTTVQNYFISSKCDIPQFNYKIDFIELSKTEEYKHYKTLETVYMGDMVTIKHNKLKINLKAKVIKIIKNCITNRIEKVELGSFKPSLATSINNSIQVVKSEIVNTKSFLQTAIDNATEQINSALGGYVVKREGELLIMDTEDISTATKVWRWNQNGLGYSSTGYNGEFRTAITADGHIVADFMDTGTLTANLIRAGILKSLNDKTLLNLEDGTFILGDKMFFNGTDLVFGSGVTLSWNQILGATDIVTQITNNTVTTAILNATIANLADSVKIGDLTSPNAKYINFSNYNNSAGYFQAVVGIDTSGALKVSNTKNTSLLGGNGNIVLHDDGMSIYATKNVDNAIEFSTPGSVNFANCAHVLGIKYADIVGIKTAFTKSTYGQDLSFTVDAGKLYVRKDGNILGSVALT